MEKDQISRNDKQLQTRLYLIKAGFELISEQGYSSVSIRNISKYAGFTQGAFYSNFNNKEEFLLTLMRIQFEKENAQLQQILTDISVNSSSLQEKLELWLTDFFQNESWLKISIELQMYAIRDKDFANEYKYIWQIHKEQITNILFKLFSAYKEITPEEAESKSLELISLSYGLALQYMLFKDDLNKYIQIIINYLVQDGISI